MSVNDNIWKIAEAYLAGTLSEPESIDLQAKLATDPLFSAEFYENINLINSLEGSGKQKRFRETLRDIQQSQTARKKTLLIPLNPQLWRTAGVAACVAILTSSITIWSLKPSIKKNDSQYSKISREVAVIKKVQAQQQVEQNKLKQDLNKNIKSLPPAPPPSAVKYTGTGFALTNDGYFVTSNHVIHNDNNSEPDSVYILNHEGRYFKAYLVAYDAAADIAVMKVEKKNFRFSKGELPYVFAKDKAALGEDIFTLGYPNDELMYSKGYISSKNGYNGNDQQYTLDLPAGHGQSGSPVIDKDGYVLGILTAIGSQGDVSTNASNTYAVSSKALMELLHGQIPNENSLHLPRTNKLGSLIREQQIEKMEPYTFSVKVYKK